MSDRFGYLSNRTRKFVRQINFIRNSADDRFAFSGANHSDPQYFQCCSGFYIDVFNILKERLQFQFELYRVPDRTWGARNPVTVNTMKFISEF